MAFENVESSVEENDRTIDASDTKQKESGLFYSSTLPSSIINWVERFKSDIITVWDVDWKLLFISKSVERLLGYRVSDLSEMQWHEKISPEDVHYIKRNINKGTFENQTFNINILHQNGNYIWSECMVAKLKDKTNNQFYYISSVKDITEKKEAEEMMVRSEKMSVAGQIAAGIAHEIRNPLTSLKGFLQLLQAGVDRKEAYYNIMIDEIEKMETITSELLFIAKPLTDHRKIESVNKMIEDVVVLLQPQAKISNIEIIFKPNTNEHIFCDRSQIKQVLINLVKNAIEAMGQEGTIQIMVQLGKTHLKINVIDEGFGVPEEIIHKLGEPFFTTKQSGTGLGIMITKKILEQHQATLKIMRNASKGSTFQITFPRYH